MVANTCYFNFTSLMKIFSKESVNENIKTKAKNRKYGRPVPNFIQDLKIDREIKENPVKSGYSMLYLWIDTLSVRHYLRDSSADSFPFIQHSGCEVPNLKQKNGHNF